MGQKLSSTHVRATSALPAIPDILQRGWDVGFVPITAIAPVMVSCSPTRWLRSQPLRPDQGRDGPTSAQFRRIQAGLRTSRANASIVCAIAGAGRSASCRCKARGTWPVARRSTMETLIILLALTTVAVPALTEAAVAATHVFAGGGWARQ